MCNVIAGMRVRVHYNLHRGDFSVLDPRTGRVICNVATITLREVEFHVSEAQRKRAIARRRRKVHAHAIGLVETLAPQDVSAMTVITYNPYRAGHFHIKGKMDQPITRKSRVTFADACCYSPDNQTP